MSLDPEVWMQRRKTPTAEEVTQDENRGDERSAFDRDRARIIHSASFRRLQSKTQVLGISEGDFRRTRLTHSMEVAQVATGIVGRLARDFQKTEELNAWLPTRELIEAICFAHDLGHPPFGHGGERALNNAILTSPIWGTDEYKSAPERHVGFEGNGQTLRLLCNLEYHEEDYGLNVTRRTLLGVLKYPVRYSAVVKKIPPDLKPLFLVKWNEWKPPKCYLDSERECVDWVLNPFTEPDRKLFTQFKAPGPNDKGVIEHGESRHKSFDCSIMDVADEIAYGVHDFEDGIALNLISRPDWEEKVAPKIDSEWAKQVHLGSATELANSLFAIGSNAGHTRKRTIGRFVGALLSSIKLNRDFKFNHPLLGLQVALDEPARVFRKALQTVIFDKIINSQAVQTLEYRGQVNLLALFRAIETDPVNLLGGVFRERAKIAKGPALLRVIADYIAGMTDEYATRMFERVFVPRHGTIFDRL